MGRLVLQGQRPPCPDESPFLGGSAEDQADAVLKAVVDELKNEATPANVLDVFMKTSLFASDMISKDVRAALVNKLEVISSDAHAAVASQTE